MKHEINYVTAETEAGRNTIMEVIRHSFKEQLSDRLKEWPVARIVDGVPVSFIIIDPYR